MLCLGVHTAGPACDLALRGDSGVVGRICRDMRRGQDQHLPRLLQTLLDQTGKTLDDIDRIGVVTGPGSFTGVRVGLAFARGLALGTGAVCAGVTLLQAALPAGQQGSAIVIFPAQRRPPDITFWTQRFRSGQPTAPPEERTLESLSDLIVEKPHMVYGEVGALCQRLPDLQVRPAEPSADLAARFAQTADPESFPPVATYVRAPDAALPKARPVD